MKKAVITFIAILLGLYGLLAFLDFRGEYPAERELWRINDQFAQAVKDPKSVPQARFDNIRRRYERLIRHYPNSRLIPLAEVLIGRVYMAQKNYDLARDQYEKVIARYKESHPNVAVAAAEDIGRSHALENNAAGVLNNYKRVLNEFPLTDTGLKVPVFIGQYHIRRNEPELASAAFSDAIVYYRRLIDQYPGTETEFNAWRLLATCYFEQNEKRKGVEMLGEVLNRFATSPYMTNRTADTILKLINTTSVIYLKDYDLPIEIYERFIEEHPDHSKVKYFKALIQSLQVLKEEGVNVKI